MPLCPSQTAEAFRLAGSAEADTALPASLVQAYDGSMSTHEPIIVSACLLGEPCRYDGASRASDAVKEYLIDAAVVPICPEQMGGLATPRNPCEIQSDGSIRDASGADWTKEYEQGADIAVMLAKSLGCKEALLKAYSPSCGVHAVYDGTFSATLIPGEGVTAKALREAGVVLLDENDVEKLLEGENAG